MPARPQATRLRGVGRVLAVHAVCPYRPDAKRNISPKPEGGGEEGPGQQVQGTDISTGERAIIGTTGTREKGLGGTQSKILQELVV
jgi:hypothetical protein